MSQLANRAELMIMCESKPMLKLHMSPLLIPSPGFQPGSKKVSWSDKLITEYIVAPEILRVESLLKVAIKKNV